MYILACAIADDKALSTYRCGWVSPTPMSFRIVRFP